MEDKNLWKDIWIFIEQQEGEIHNSAYELISIANNLADKLGSKAVGVLVGDEIQDLAKDLLDYPLDKIILCNDSEMEYFHEEKYTNLLTQLIQEQKPAIMLFGATNKGRSIAPRVAARIKAGLTADCTGLDIDENNNLLQTRPAFGGDLMAKIVCPDDRPQMATVRPKVFPPAEKDGNRADLHKYSPSNSGPLFSDVNLEILERNKTETKTTNIREADIIVAGGRGMKKPKNFELLEEVADLLGGAVGASRPVVDDGWIPYSHQVGQTGKSVSPQLYIACGISGAIQHLAGMQSSDCIVAINSDSTAPIFDIADYGITEDVLEFLPTFINKLQN